MRGHDPADLRTLEMSVDKMGQYEVSGQHGQGNFGSDLQDFRADLCFPWQMTALLLRNGSWLARGSW